MKKRIFAAALAAAMLCAVLSGCSGSSSSSAAASSASESAAPQANEITVGIAQDLDESLDPHVAVAAGTKEVMFNVFEGLMKPTSDGDLTPAIAEPTDMAKKAIKSEKLTPFGGFFSIMEQFDALSRSTSIFTIRKRG